MSISLLFGIIVSIILFYSIINAVVKEKHPVKKSFAGAVTGLAALAAVNLLAPFTGVSMPVSVMSVLIAVIGGIPGVTLMLSLNAFF